MNSVINRGGFSLIEMIIVLAVLSILLMMAVPSGLDKKGRHTVTESLRLVDQYKPMIEAHYRAQGSFPADNAVLGVPAADKIIGNYLASVTVSHGAMTLQLGKKIMPKLQGKKVTIRPLYVPNEPLAPVSWLCGYNHAPAGMLASGDNHTNVSPAQLPIDCR